MIVIEAAIYITIVLFWLYITIDVINSIQYIQYIGNHYQSVWYVYLLAQLLSKNELQTLRTLFDVHVDGQASLLGAVGIS